MLGKLIISNLLFTEGYENETSTNRDRQTTIAKRDVALRVDSYNTHYCRASTVVYRCFELTFFNYAKWTRCLTI